MEKEDDGYSLWGSSSWREGTTVSGREIQTIPLFIFYQLFYVEPLPCGEGITDLGTDSGVAAVAIDSGG